MARVSATRQEADSITRRVRFELGREIRNARLDAGASLRAVAERVSMSHAQLGRIERAEIDNLTVEQLSRACAAVGLTLAVRAYPGSGLALDAGQLAMLVRLRAQLPQGTRVRTEVPLEIPGDRRAWDAVLDLDPLPTPLEAEARLRDLQSLDRRIGLKLRDSQFDRVLLLVNETEHNRAMLRLHRESLRTSMPLDSREVLRALRAGRTPAASGIVIL